MDLTAHAGLRLVSEILLALGLLDLVHQQLRVRVRHAGVPSSTSSRRSCSSRRQGASASNANLPESLSLQFDDCVHDDYAAKLLPVAIGYSAGLLDYVVRHNLSLLTPDFLTLSTLVECALIRYPDPKPAERDL
jgi:hypothetical protein